MFNLKKETNDYLIYCQKQKQLSQHTIRAYTIDLAQYSDVFPSGDFNKESLSVYMRHLHEKYKPKTVRRKIASLKAFAHYLFRNGIIEGNPFDKVDTYFKEPICLPKSIPAHIINSILDAAYGNIKTAPPNKALVAVRNAAVVELLFATGARISEICSLKNSDIDVVERTVKIFGKGSRERIIQIENNDVLKIIKEYITINGNVNNQNGFFFLNNRKSRLSEQSVRTILRNFEKQINSNIHITPHMFRHSVATMLLEEDVDIRYIQKILGHSSITTTQIYTHVTSAKQKEILRTKHPRNKMHLQSA